MKGELGEVPGEIPAVKRRPTPGPLTSMALEPTVQVKVDTDGTPLELPPARPHGRTRTPARAVRSTPAHRAEAPLELPPVRPQFEAEPGPELPPVRMDDAPPPAPARRTGATACGAGAAAGGGEIEDARARVDYPRAHRAQGQDADSGALTPAAAFDAVEADFFAREADLYKREAVETFDDLDSSGGDGAVQVAPQAQVTLRRPARPAADIY